MYEICTTISPLFYWVIEGNYISHIQSRIAQGVWFLSTMDLDLEKYRSHVIVIVVSIYEYINSKFMNNIKDINIQ